MQSVKFAKPVSATEGLTQAGWENFVKRKEAIATHFEEHITQDCDGEFVETETNPLLTVRAGKLFAKIAKKYRDEKFAVFQEEESFLFLDWQGGVVIPADFDESDQKKIYKYTELNASHARAILELWEMPLLERSRLQERSEGSFHILLGQLCDYMDRMLPISKNPGSTNFVDWLGDREQTELTFHYAETPASMEWRRYVLDNQEAIATFHKSPFITYKNWVESPQSLFKSLATHHFLDIEITERLSGINKLLPATMKELKIPLTRNGKRKTLDDKKAETLSELLKQARWSKNMRNCFHAIGPTITLRKREIVPASVYYWLERRGEM